MKNFNYLKYLPSIFLFIYFSNLSAQQVVIEHVQSAENSTLKAKRADNGKNYSTVYSDEQKKISITDPIPNQPTMGSDGVNAVLTVNFEFDPNISYPGGMIIIYNEAGYLDVTINEQENPVTINVPEGNYDILTEFINNATGIYYTIIKEQVNISTDTSITMNIEDAVNHITINAYDENGGVLLPGEINPNTGSPSEVFFDRLLYFHPTNSVLLASYFTLSFPIEGGPERNFYINDVSDRYSVASSFIGANYDVGNYYTKFETLNGISDNVTLENDPETWVAHTEKFQPSLLGTNGIYPGFCTSTTMNGSLISGWTIYNQSNINPEEAFKGFLNTAMDDNPVDFFVSPAIVDVFEDFGLGEEGFYIKGNPVLSDGEGGILYGSGDFSFVGNVLPYLDGSFLPYLGNAYYIKDDLQYEVLPFHPKFTFTSEVNTLYRQGNNVPIVITAFKANTFLHQNKGRYGENRESDVFATQLEAKQNGTTVFSGEFLNFFGNLPTSGQIELVLTNANTQIEGMEGKNTTTITYDAGQADAPPTLQHLQFRDADDRATSIFDSTEGATVRIAAGDFAFVELNGETGYFDYVDGNEVEFHYSIHNQNDWTELELTENPDFFQMPAFGNYYEASLASITNENNDVWYDAKIICTDVAGNKQEQIISPAFKINNTLGIQDLTDSNFTVYPNPFAGQLNIALPENIKGNYTFKVTDLTGKTVYSKVQNEKSFVWNGSSLPKGVYILTIENNGKIIGKKIMKK